MNWKLIGAVASAVFVADFLGNKIANSITGPEMNASDALTNQLKITGAKTAMGVVGFMAFGKLFGAV